MTTFNLTAPCNFGVEAVLAREIRNLGFEITSTVDGRVNFTADELGLCKANIHLRTAERVLISVKEFKAESFEELFQGVKEINWEDYLPVDAEFPIAKVSSIRSKLFSPTDIQKITKKAIVERLKTAYKQEWFEETGSRYTVLVQINKDIVHVYLETSGPSLHKRGYRMNKNLAPIRETLASAMVDLTPWRTDRILADPLCGSGTVLIEAALKGINKAPGINRRFRAESWHFIDSKYWRLAREEAHDLINRNVEFRLQGYDIDGRVIKYARENAKLAGVDKYIHFQQCDVRNFSHSGKYGFIICNPPYGERLEDRESVAALYKDMRKVFDRLDTWSYSIITSFGGFEKVWGKEADRRRKLYNGMLKTNLYQYMGPKPPKRKDLKPQNPNPPL